MLLLLVLSVVYSDTYIESKEKTRAQFLVCVYLANKTKFDSDNVF